MSGMEAMQSMCDTLCTNLHLQSLLGMSYLMYAFILTLTWHAILAGVAPKRKELPKASKEETSGSKRQRLTKQATDAEASGLSKAQRKALQALTAKRAAAQVDDLERDEDGEWHANPLEAIAASEKAYAQRVSDLPARCHFEWEQPPQTAQY